MMRRGMVVVGVSLLGLVGAVPLPGSGGAGRLHEMRPMLAARAAHTATTLADGRVLLVGGFTDRGDRPDIEFFEPGPDRFVPGPRMRVVSHSHTATRLQDGRVLITGGYGDGGQTLDRAELFDPATGRFTEARPLLTARANHVATLLDDGRVLLAGGLGRDWTYLATAELFDPASGTFEAAAAMSVPREGHAATLLADGRVLVVGGHEGPRRNLTLHQTAELFDPRTRAFSRTGPMTVRRHKHDAVRLQDGRVLVTGGSDERDGDGAYTSTEIFEPATRRFTPGPGMRRSRYKHLGSSTLLADGRVLIAGGADIAELYDPRAGSFAEVPGTSSLPGLFPAVAALADGRVITSGGYGRRQGPGRGAWIFTDASR